MSLWKINDLELEIDLEDADFQKTYRLAFEELGKEEEKLVRVGNAEDVTISYCNMFYKLFDAIFGEGTGDKIFSGRHNARICDEVYSDFIGLCSEQVKSVEKRRETFTKKYLPNRAQRRSNNHRG